MGREAWLWRGVVAGCGAGIALFTVIFAGGHQIGGAGLILGALVGSAGAGIWMSPLFGRAGGLGWFCAFGAALGVTVAGGAVAGAVFDPALRHGGPLTGAMMGPAMVLAHPVPVLVWLAGFGALHLGLQRGRRAQGARDRLRIFAE